MVIFRASCSRFRGLPDSGSILLKSVVWNNSSQDSNGAAQMRHSSRFRLKRIAWAVMIKHIEFSRVKECPLRKRGPSTVGETSNGDHAVVDCATALIRTSTNARSPGDPRS